MDYICIGFLLALSIVSSIQLVTSISPALLLTPLIHENKTNARLLSTVNASLFLDTPSHAGFLNVEPAIPEMNSNTFFWYFPVQGQAVENTAWIIWLQGGPGVSSMAGLFDEIGPFQYKNKELKKRKYAWSTNHSLLFIDNPVGVGYSFTDSPNGFPTNKNKYADHLYSALQQFLTIFPELRKAPLFIAGESYAGHYVPALATRILEAGQLTDEWAINLQGLILGNPVMNREDIMNLTDTFYQWGLIDSQGVQAVKPLQDMYTESVKKGRSELAFKFRDQLLDALQNRTMQQQTYNLLVDDYNHLEEFEEFLGKEEIREALHVGETVYNFRNETAKAKLIPDFLGDVNSIMGPLLNKYKVLIYCGQLDLTAPCVPNAEARRKKWQWNKRDDFINAPRVPWWYDETVAGYVKNGGGFEEALVRGAGHLAPIDKPAEVLQLITSFIQNIEMELPPNYEPVKDDVHPNTTIYATILPNTTTEKIATTIVNSTVKPVSIQTTVRPVSKDSLKSTEPVAAASNGVPAGTIVSIIFNIVLVLLLALGAFLYYRLKKKSEDFFYSNVENNSEDLFLT